MKCRGQSDIADDVPLFLITENGRLIISTNDKPLSPKPGQVLVSLVDPEEPQKSAERAAQESTPS